MTPANLEAICKASERAIDFVRRSQRGTQVLTTADDKALKPFYSRLSESRASMLGLAPWAHPNPQHSGKNLRLSGNMATSAITVIAPRVSLNACPLRVKEMFENQRLIVRGAANEKLNSD